MPEIDVIICAHNPRPDYLSRTLAALQAQTLPKAQWTLTLVDNASEPPLADSVDLSWQPNGRIVCETQLGLTMARLCGIDQATSPIVLFVDDDNRLAPNYLETALQIGEAFPQLGMWGGRVIGEFETEPEPWARPYLDFLALRELSRPLWSNLTAHGSHVPCGAGMVLRKAVAQHYAELTRNDPMRQHIGRKGQQLLSAEDSDLAYTAIEMGLGLGMFPELSLHHLIPSRRLERDYLLDLIRNMALSHHILEAIHGKLPQPDPPMGFVKRIRFRRLLASLPDFERDVLMARRDAKSRFFKEYAAQLKPKEATPDT